MNTKTATHLPNNPKMFEDTVNHKGRRWWHLNCENKVFVDFFFTFLHYTVHTVVCKHSNFRKCFKHDMLFRQFPEYTWLCNFDRFYL